jgi:hypothetical protein
MLRLPAIKALVVVVGVWGVLVGLHGLGVPGVRMLRIPFATGLAPASVQRALAAMIAPPSLPSDPLEQGDGPRRPYRPVTPFADAGPEDQIRAVRRDLVADLRIQDTGFAPDGRLARDWKATVRRAYTPSGAQYEISLNVPSSDGPGPCKHERHHFLGWQGVYVDGDDALALLKEREDCVAPGPAFPGEVEHMQYALRRINGTWRIEDWLGRDKFQG